MDQPGIRYEPRKSQSLPQISSIFCFSKTHWVALNPSSELCLIPSLAFIRCRYVSTVWLLNFTVGIFEIPDVLPFVGNLDETAAAWLLFSSLNYLGIHLLPDPNRATRFTLQSPKEK